MNELKIRKMETGDALGLKKNVFTDMEISEIEKNVANNVREMESGGLWTYLVAENSGEVVGITYLKLSDCPVEKHLADLVSIVVAEEYRNQGICRSLVEGASRIAKESGVEILKVSVRAGTSAETVYQKLGFVCYGHLEKGIKDADGTYFDKKLFTLNVS